MNNTGKKSARQFHLGRLIPGTTGGLMRKTFITFFTVLMFLTFTCAAFGADAGKLKISVLCDDTVISDQFVTEHGVSILVELPNGHRWLADTGTTDIYLENAKRLGANLDNLNGITISHGHDDHAGGLIFYPRLKGKPPIFGHPLIWVKSYQIKTGEPVRVTGMPYLARKYAASAFRPVTGTIKLDENLYFFTDVPRASGSFAPIKGNFFNEDGTGPVTLFDDATLVIKTPRGLVAIFGCGHAGYTNILRAINKEFPKEKLLAVIGGLHLMNANEKVLAEAVAFTNSIKADNFAFYGGHCTGDNAIKYFRAKFGANAVKGMGSGRVLTF
jgi:7,8-dihydropterin-6-yl-methyl-4-(beta-D-ribofuranosyl)aminobenzene 5'-phosphate synthase